MGGKRPSVRMRKAAKHLAENGGSLGEAMIAAGYSRSVADTPTKVTSTKSWKELMDEYLPEDLLARKHRQILESGNEQVVAKGLEMGYKLRGTYAPEKKIVKATFSLAEALGDDDSEFEGINDENEYVA